MIDEEATMIRDAAMRLFADHCDRNALARAASGEWPTDLWDAAEETGLTLALVSEAGGGAALPIDLALSLAGIAAEHAAPIPFGETMIAAWLLDRVGQSAPPGPLTFATLDGSVEAEGPSFRVRGAASRVPWGRAARIVVLLGGRMILLEDDEASFVAGINMANEPRDDVTVDIVVDAARLSPSPLSADDLHAVGAALRTIQIAGALRRVSALAVDYAQQRKQFGRAISQFQAIQQNLAVLATQAAVAGMAAAIAQGAVTRGKLFPDVAIAKARAGEAAGIGAAIAHQVHGAIGFTLEHDLQFSTKRLWSWRDEFSNEAVWNLAYGRHLVAQGADALWPAITAA